MIATPELGGDALDGDALGRAEHDPGPGHRPLLARRRPDDRLRGRTVGSATEQRRSGRMGHARNRSELSDYPLDISGTRH